MKALPTDAGTQALKNTLRDVNCYSFSKLTYIDDDGEEQVFLDWKYPLKIKKRSEPPKYANVAFNPAVAEIEFDVINRAGIYSPKNTGSSLFDILKRDRVFKFYDGKDVAVQTESSAALVLANGYKYFTQGTSSIILDVANASGNTDEYFQDLFHKYDDHLYDSTTYSPGGYIVFDITNDTPETETFTKFSVACNSAKGKVYYRMSNDPDEFDAVKESTGWDFAGNTIDGTQEFTVNKSITLFIQIAVIFDTSSWSDSMAVTDVTWYQTALVDFLLIGTFFLDDPKFKDPPSPGISTVRVKGRNAYKRALETELNTKDLSGGGGTNIDDFIKDVADLANIDYSASSIADLSGFGARTLSSGYGDQVKIDQIFADIMAIIGKTYRMWIDDSNVLSVALRDTSYLVDWVHNFHRYKNAEQREVSEKQLQRITFLSAQQPVGASELLDTETITTAGTTNFSWGGNAVYKYPVVTNNSGNVDGLVTDIDLSNESAIVTTTGSTVNITVEIWGNKFSGAEPDYMGEAVNATNILNNNGFRRRDINPLLISHAEAKSKTEDFIDEFGAPAYDVTINNIFLNPLLEINDLVLLVSEDFFEQTIYETIGLDYRLDSEVKKRSIHYLKDTGRKYTDTGPIIWDRDYFGTAASIQWDIGIIWDATHRIGATRSEILATNPKKFNVGFN